jgi:hypothetical protein
MIHEIPIYNLFFRDSFVAADAGLVASPAGQSHSVAAVESLMQRQMTMVAPDLPLRQAIHRYWNLALAACWSSPRTSSSES